MLELVERGIQTAADRLQGGDVDRRGDDVVARLAEVHVVVRVHGVFPAAAAGQDLVGPCGDHLVGVHVGGGARAGLKDPHHELIVEASVEHLAGRLSDRAGGLGGEQAEIPVYLRRRALDAGDRAHKRNRHGKLPDRKVPDRAGGLGPPVGLRRDPDRAEAVAFLALRAGGRGQASFIRSMFARSWAISIPRLTHWRPIRHCSASFSSR